MGYDKKVKVGSTDLKKKPTIDLMKKVATTLDLEHPFHKLKNPPEKAIEKIFVKTNNKKVSKKK